SLTSAANVLADCHRIQIAIHPVPPDLGRHARVEDFTRLRWFLIGVDAIRPDPKNTSATDAEKDRAFEVVSRAVDGLLHDHDWPLPVVIDSGNGFHVLWLIDLPNDEEAKDLVSRAVKYIAQTYSVDGWAQIEREVHNTCR